MSSSSLHSKVITPDGFGFVMLAMGAITMVQYGLGCSVMNLRKMFKTSRFQNLPEILDLQKEHKKEFGTEINEDGYPDMGCGKYADHLTYKEWVTFNNAQRSHYDMIESSGLVIPCLALNGLFLPYISAGLGAAYAVGRLLYGIGYQSSQGANGRFPGAILAGIGSVGLYGLTVFNGLRNLRIV